MMIDTHNTRIAWLLPSAWFYWQPTISELSKQFPETKIFTARWPGYSPGYEDTLQVEIIGQRRIVEIQANDKGYSSNFTYVSPLIVFPLLKFRPHVIFSNSFGLWTMLSLLLKLIVGWKVVIAYEGSSPGVDFRHSKLRLWVRRVMVNLADACISNSNAGGKYLIDVLHASPQFVFICPYEIPAAKSLLNAEATPLNESVYTLASKLKKPIFLFVGRIIPRKGLRDLLDACILLHKDGCKDFTLLVVGDGEQQAELEEYSQAHNLEPSVQWVGRVSYDQINTYFQVADVFVLPTLEDTWGVVISEAMLFGKPILASTGAGASELVSHGQNGYVFHPGQPEELAKLMRNFIETPEIIEEMGNCSKKIMSEKTPESASIFLADVVKKVLC